MRKLLAVLAFLIPSLSSNAENITFKSDPEVPEIAKAYYQDCIDMVKGQFNLDLDGSDESIKLIESVLDNLSEHVRNNGMDKNRVYNFSKMFGFYIGEVYRKNHGNVIWGNVKIDGKEYYALGKSKDNSPFFWPVANVMKRIYKGREANIHHYYSAIVGK
ncbi:hypothetical protein J7384_10865 [Endozoicomonas sp. G2_1]|uniref:hypothetical protein n=1 Tax=Endozoicomonas sp. G2_1 TaxID=2821091 RepID=UPI001ADBFAE9|nr:hypothetical protein [Endozoicomonas sp. G2_1]MBO9490858.1 hypothetical protein [Endozoicomonas sp. G2_1]